MELDYPAIKALSAPTRIKILNALLEKDGTPTSLSDRLDKSKSTISSHLSVLEDAELVEKEVVEGRRRVTYTPTSKARAIVEGRERTVKFSVASSILTGIAGIGLVSWPFLPSMTTSVGKSRAESDGQAGALSMHSQDAAPEASEATSASSDVLAQLLTVENGMFVLGAVLIGIGIGLLYYGWQLRQLNKTS